MAVWQLVFEIVTEKPLNYKDYPPFTPVEEKFNPYHSHQTGQFTSGTGARYAGMDAVSPEQQKLIQARMDKLGIDMDTGVANANAVLDHAQSNPQYEALKNWYVDANNKATQMAKETGVSEDQAAGMIAAMSPAVPWNIISSKGELRYPNVENAATIAKAMKMDSAITFTPELVGGLSKYEKYTGFSKMQGETHKLSELSAEQVSYILKPLVQAYPANITKAVKIARGQAPADVLGGAKVRSFYSNIVYPSKPSGVTIDTWMIRNLSGRSDLGRSQLAQLVASPTAQGLKGIGAYPYFAEMINRAAAQHNLLPQEAQAIIWTQSRHDSADVEINKIEGI